MVKNGNGTYTLTDLHDFVIDYSAAGRMTSMVDRNGNTLTFAYDPNNPVGTYIQDAAGRKIILTLNGDGRITQAQDPLGRIFSYIYDASGNLLTVTDPHGGVVSYTYADHNITQMLNPNGHATFYFYDALDRAYLNYQTGETNRVEILCPTMTSATVTDAAGHMTNYTFNEYGLPLTIKDPLNNTTTNTYDANLRLISTKDALNHTTSFEYDAYGLLTKITDPAGSQTLYAYTPDHHLIASSTDALNHVTSDTYDADGNLLTVVDPHNAVTTYTTDAPGRILTEKDPLNHITTFEYNANGYINKIIDALGNQTLFNTNAVGKLLSKTEPSGAVMTYTYDNLNRLTSVTFADNTSIQYTYDAFGNLLTQTDQKGNVTAYLYDDYDRVSQITDADGGQTHYAYNLRGNLTSITHPMGGVLPYTYDALSRVITEKDELNHQTTYTYDLLGNLASRTDANGQSTAYAYDNLNRLTLITYPGNVTIAFTYDVLDRRLTMVDATGTTLYSYDAVGQLLSVNGPLNNDTVSYTYDLNGNRLTLTNPDNKIIVSAYDALNRQTSLTDEDGAMQYTYDVNSNLLSITYASGASMHDTYDTLNRVTKVENKDNTNTVISSFAYEYDSAGMATKTTFKDSSVRDFVYDSRNRVTREVFKKPNANGVLKVKTDDEYVYNLNNNRTNHNTSMTLQWFWNKEAGDMPQATLDALTAAGYGPTGSSNTPFKFLRVFTFDAANEVLNFTFNIDVLGQMFWVRDVQYAYDANGSRITKTVIQNGVPDNFVTDYAYDPQERLTQLIYTNAPASVGIASASYQYNGDGLRIKSVEGTKTRKYIYDGFDVLVERSANGNTTKKSYSRDSFGELRSLKSGTTGYFRPATMKSNRLCSGIFILFLCAGFLPGYAQADVVSSIESRVARFQERYGIALIYKDLTFSGGSIQSAPVSDKEYGLLNDYLNLFEEEINTYPPVFFQEREVRAIALVTRLFAVDKPVQGLYNPGSRVMLFDILRFSDNKALKRHSIHHELFHMMVLQTPGYQMEEKSWSDLNPVDFAYGEQTKSWRELNPVNTGAPNQPGFVTDYAMTSVEEDKAEVFACLMQDKHRMLITRWAQKDVVMRQKIQAIKNFVAAYCPEMDEGYWNRQE